MRWLARNRVVLKHKLLSVGLVLVVYTCFRLFRSESVAVNSNWPLPTVNSVLQFSGLNEHEEQKDGHLPLASSQVNAVNVARQARVINSVSHIFQNYRSAGWGHDSINPLTGDPTDHLYGWGSFPIEAANSFAVMNMWDEFRTCLAFILKEARYDSRTKVVNPVQVTHHYIGGLLSIVELSDSGIIPSSLLSALERDLILRQAVLLANQIAPAYDPPSGTPWPSVNLATSKGQPIEGQIPSSSVGGEDDSTGRTGPVLLEYKVLTRLTGDDVFDRNATIAWKTFIGNNDRNPFPSLGQSPPPIDKVEGGAVGVVSKPNIHKRSPVGGTPFSYSFDRDDALHYSALLKVSILAPLDGLSKRYQDRWESAVDFVRNVLVSRSAPTKDQPRQHLFLGSVKSQSGARSASYVYINEQTPTACSSAGHIILGAAHLQRPDLLALGKALLETCHHIQSSTGTGLLPLSLRWDALVPSFPTGAVYIPPLAPLDLQDTAPTTDTAAALAQYDLLHDVGFWIANPVGQPLSGDYMEALFLAWRVTGQRRYREWAWEAYVSFEHSTRIPQGYGAVRDVMISRYPAGDKVDSVKKETAKVGSIPSIHPTSNHMPDHTSLLETVRALKFLYLIFDSDPDHSFSLDHWVFGVAGHVYRREG